MWGLTESRFEEVPCVTINALIVSAVLRAVVGRGGAGDHSVVGNCLVGWVASLATGLVFHLNLTA